MSHLTATITLALTAAAQAAISKLMDSGNDRMVQRYAPPLPRCHKRGGAAADKRAARRCRNIRKHPRGAA